MQQKMDIILIGNPGVAKSFMSKYNAYAAAHAGIKEVFTSIMDLPKHLISAYSDHSLLKKLQYYTTVHMLACDQSCYLPLGRHGSNLFFQVIDIIPSKVRKLSLTIPFR